MYSFVRLVSFHLLAMTLVLTRGTLDTEVALRVLLVTHKTR